MDDPEEEYDLVEGEEEHALVSMDDWSKEM